MRIIATGIERLPNTASGSPQWRIKHEASGEHYVISTTYLTAPDAACAYEITKEDEGHAISVIMDNDGRIISWRPLHRTEPYNATAEE